MTKEDAVKLLNDPVHKRAQQYILALAFGWLRTCASNGDSDAMALLFEVSRLNAVEVLYNELILNVGSKFQYETRHETALRYIKEAEVPKFYMPACDPNAFKAIKVGPPPGTLDKS